LNSESSIRYPNVFTGDRREVEVTGQSYFEVAKNVNAPFVVRTSNMQVEVLGTHFDINAYRDEENLAVTLLEGSVRVSNDNFDALELKPREQTQLNHAGKLSKLRNVDIEKVVAWKNGKFDFGTKTDLNTILRQITRWYNIELESGVPGNKYYGGSISRDVNLSEVLKVLETAGDIKFSVRENKLRVLQ
jgi:transmembrane sensor